MRRAPPLTHDAVLAGGGHTHALVLRMWAMRPPPGLRVTLINPGPTAPYSGMLPGLIAGHYAREDLTIDLDRLCRMAGARLIAGAVEGVDLAARTVAVAGRPPVAFDTLSLDIGITSAMPDLPGFAAHAVPAKPLGALAERWQAFVAAAAAGRASAEVAVIGGGAAGMELALAAAHRLGRGARVSVIERGAAVLPGLGPAARRRILAAARRLGVSVLTGSDPAAVTEAGVLLADGREVPAAFVIGAAGARPQAWLAGTGLALTDGFVRVGPTLQASDPGVFAAGDCAHLDHAPRPKAGVFAVRAAPVLAHNLAAAAQGGPLRRFRPQRDYLRLLALGGRAAVADRSGLAAAGAWAWAWKDRIDRRFMRRFADLQPMAAAGEQAAGAGADQPLCGGCGAKVGPGALAGGLAALPPPQRPDVLRGAGDDAALLAHAAGVQAITVDHLRPLVDDPFTMARIAALHALGDVWAMGAAPQAGLLSLVLPPLSPALQARTVAEAAAGAAAVLRAAGADLVGGHTAEGAEATFGLAVTGLAARALPQGGARPGDVLILTRPIGSGTVFAAAMAGTRVSGLITGEAVAAALDLMLRPGGAAAAALSPEATALTDVTGFGLAGHLLALLDAAGCAAVLDLAAVPLLPGAAALAAAGVRSTLWPANRAAALGRIDLGPHAADAPAAVLLHDPQTAGGFLAAVQAGAAPSLLAALRALGEPAAAIGTCTEGPPAIRLA